jgi:hypothetical protein
MEINKLGLLIFGMAFLFLGLYDLSIGETNGFSAGNMSSMTITFKERPIEFVLSIVFKVGIGGLAIRKSFSNTDTDE